MIVPAEADVAYDALREADFPMHLFLAIPTDQPDDEEQK